MKKFVLETKAALGVAPKTVDVDFDEKAASLKTINSTLSDYRSAIERAKSASESLVSAMESMRKVMEAMARGDDVPESVKSVVKDYTQLTQKSQSEFLVDFKKTIDDCEGTAEITALAGKCKSLEAKRHKVMSEYDAYRESVSKKEETYRKKGKDLAESKGYNEEVTKRDSLKAEFESIDKEFKQTYAELEKKKLHSYMHAISIYLAGMSQLMASIQKEVELTKEKADEVKV